MGEAHKLCLENAILGFCTKLVGAEMLGVCTPSCSRRIFPFNPGAIGVHDDVGARRLEDLYGPDSFVLVGQDERGEVFCCGEGDRRVGLLYVSELFEVFSYDGVEV